MSPLRRSLLRCLVVLALAVPGAAVVAPAALAATVFNLSLTGGSGTVLVGGTLYAKAGGAIRVGVITSSDTQCMQLTGAFTARATLTAGRASWAFPVTAGAGDGVRTVTATAYPGFDADGCTGTPQSPKSTSFVLDNTGPVVTAALAPAPNADGWDGTDVAITWSATDAASGVASGPTPRTDSQLTETAGVTKVAIATDRLGNVGDGAATVRVDKGAPVVVGSRSPAPNAAGWNDGAVTVSFTCSDALSGIKSCPGATTLTTGAADQAVTGTAVDNAGNSASATVGGIGIDTAAPTLSGAPTTSPGADGWYTGDVTIRWTAADDLSGLAGPAPADSTITSEGPAQTASASVVDRAGNATSATSPPVRIDRTAPTTRATAPAGWTAATDVTVALDASDALSGVAATYYQLDGAPRRSGTSVPVSTEGVHDLTFWSVDTAGNAETPTTVQVRIDRTAPSIRHQQAPAPNAAGWNDTAVTVTFSCADGTGSGVASCTPPRTVESEGAQQEVTGTATDAAGNTATDPASVSIDTTPPTITARPDRPAGGNGWYDHDVTVTFACADALSGIASCPADQNLGEGRARAATGTARDAAGNSASAGVSGVDVDTTAPELSGAAVAGPGRDGWYTGDVTVRWTAADALSGLDPTPLPDSVVTGEGADLSVTASVSDQAGNPASATVGGIRIDRTAPTTLASVPAAPTGWYAGQVVVTLDAGTDLSGIAATYYAVDGGDAQAYTEPFTYAVTGEHTFAFWSVDRAGNVEDRTAPGHTLTVRIDGVAPTITGTRMPAPNADGWNNSPVTVSFSCADEGIGVAGCSDPATLSSEGKGQSVTGAARDGVGTTSSVTVGDIDIDMTPPSVTGTPTTDPNAFGWYRGDVTVHWSGQDGLSGIAPATVPADDVVAGEGAALAAGPVSILDRAGNTGSGSLGGIRIDRTAPTIKGRIVDEAGAVRSPNAAGWFSGAVRVRFTCDDALSGVQECAGDAVLSADGADRRATGTATDRADNAAGVTVAGIDIDSQAPRSDAQLQCTAGNGYCRGTTAAVVLTAADQPGLSGVKEIRYSTDDGATWSTRAGDTADVDVTMSGSGASAIRFYAVDRAGNKETQNRVELRHDTIAPALTHTLTPAANAAGWNASDVTVHFVAGDDQDGSGLDPATVTPDRTVSTETVGTVVRGSAADLAGNVGTDSVSVKLDKTVPTVTPSASGTAGANGWYTGPVTVRFDCADQGPVQSGIATCTPDAVLSTDGAGQSAGGRATDSAGNTASTTLSGIDIDSTAPVITKVGVADGAVFVLGDPAIPAAATTCTAADTGSGVASCAVAVTGGMPNGVGTFTWKATATDRAGNVTTRAGGYRVIYRWDGFDRLITRTARQLSVILSVFKGGSTIPLKFRLRKADGTVVQATTAPQWLTPAAGSPVLALAGELSFSDPETTGTAYRWDGGGQQYGYTWSTKGLGWGYQYQVGVRLDDGTTHVVTIGLR